MRKRETWKCLEKTFVSSCIFLSGNNGWAPKSLFSLPPALVLPSRHVKNGGLRLAPLPSSFFLFSFLSPGVMGSDRELAVNCFLKVEGGRGDNASTAALVLVGSVPDLAKLEFES